MSMTSRRASTIVPQLTIDQQYIRERVRTEDTLDSFTEELVPGGADDNNIREYQRRSR